MEMHFPPSREYKSGKEMLANYARLRSMWRSLKEPEKPKPPIPDRVLVSQPAPRPSPTMTMIVPGHRGQKAEIAIYEDVAPPSPQLIENTTTRIIRVVCARYGLTRNEFFSIRRCSKLALARHIAMYLMKTETPLSLPQIGLRFGGRDHTTVLYGVRRIAARVAADPEFAAEIEAVRALVTGKEAEGE